MNFGVEKKRETEMVVCGLLKDYLEIKSLMNLTADEMISLYPMKFIQEVKSFGGNDPVTEYLILKEKAEEQIEDARRIVVAFESTVSMIPEDVWVLLRDMYLREVDVDDINLQGRCYEAVVNYNIFFLIAVKRKIGERVYKKYARKEECHGRV